MQPSLKSYVTPPTTNVENVFNAIPNNDNRNVIAMEVDSNIENERLVGIKGIEGRHLQIGFNAPKRTEIPKKQ